MLKEFSNYIKESIGDIFNPGDIVIYCGNQLSSRIGYECEIISKSTNYNKSYNIRFLEDSHRHVCDPRYLTLLKKKEIKRLYTENDPYGEEVWENKIYNDQREKYLFLKDFDIVYNNVDEAIFIANTLISIGFSIFDYPNCSWNEWGAFCKGLSADFTLCHKRHLESKDRMNIEEFIRLTKGFKKYKKIEHPDDPYGEENWGYVQESVDYNLYDCKFMYNNTLERLKTAEYLINLGFNVYDEKAVLDMDYQMGDWDCFTWDKGENCFVESVSKAFGSLRTVHLEDISDKKYKKIEHPDDPYGEEDWGYVQESLSDFRPSFEIGDHVVVNGIVDDEEFENYHDIISNISKDTLLTNMNENGECDIYEYRGISYYLTNWGWWVTPYNLKKVEISRNYTDEDPYGEENANESIKFVGKAEFEKVGEELTKIVPINNKLLKLLNEKYTGWMKINTPSINSYYIHVIEWTIKSMDLIFFHNKLYGIPDNSLHEHDTMSYTMNPGNIRRIESIQKYNLIGFSVNRKYTSEDPYGEEEWESLKIKKEDENVNELETYGKRKFEIVSELSGEEFLKINKGILNENYTGWLKIDCPGLSYYYLHVIKWKNWKTNKDYLEKYESIQFEYNKVFYLKDNKLYETDSPPTFTLNQNNSEHRIESIQKLIDLGQIFNRKYTPEDPYGEEDWDDLDEGKKSTEKTLLDLEGKNMQFSRMPCRSIYDIMRGRRRDKDERDNIVKLINKTKGKKVKFTNSKEGKNIKKERISNGGYWKQNFVTGNWDFYLIGTKKDYNVDIHSSIGYYADEPNRIISPLDPYGEEDWNESVKYDGDKIFESKKKEKLLRLDGSDFINGYRSTIFYYMDGELDSLRKRDLVSARINHLRGKVFFFHEKNSKKRKRIINRAYWTQINENRPYRYELMIITGDYGFPATFSVNLTKPFGYYDIERKFNEMDPYGEEDWD